MSKVIVFGNKDFAELAFFYLTNDSEHDVVAFTMDREYIQQSHFMDRPVVEFDELIVRFPPSEFKLFIPMSYSKLNENRIKKYLEAKAMGYEFISYISSKATYYNTPIGENCFIFENNVIQPYTTIGNNVILWSGNHIGHHSTIEDHVFIASHVVISGHVRVGEGCFIGVNATVNNSLSIGKYNIISSGALIHRSTEDHAVYKAPRAEKADYKSNVSRGL